MKIYPENLPEQIEFDFLKSQLANYAVSPEARTQLLELLPVSDFEAIKEELLLTNEMLSVYESSRNVPALATADVTEALALLRIQNAVLAAQQFLDVKELLERYNHLHKYFTGLMDLLPLVAALVAPFPPNKEVPEAIDKILEPNGQVRSNASPELMKIRSQLGRKRTAADRIFYRSLKKYGELGVLGDFRESVHENKRVLAINAAYKGRVNGIFHGSSAKNSLYFVEPAEMIEINNEIAILEEQEKREIKRILMALTTYVAQFRTPIQERAKLMVRLDFLHAKGKFAFDQKAHMPQLLPTPQLFLEQAYNPVLRHFNKLKGRDVVPLNLTLDAEQRMLVISGPNAGGKSLTLKTAGLLIVMVQSGLLIPVHPRSKVGIFQNLFGDIGDSQSIENELSTYSSKLEKMKVFLQWADGDTLLLIDEFGSGSDPDLGGAIAQVFLQKLNSYGAYGVLTTHYNGIKALAAKLSGVANGSMRFNKQSFEPEYVLQMGLPGSSYTFEVAMRSGIPEQLIAAAQQRLEKRTLHLDNLLVAIQDEKNLLHAERTQLKERTAALEQLAKDHERQIQKLEEKVAKQTDLNESHSDHLKWGKRFNALVDSYLKTPTIKNKKEVTGRFLRMLTEGAAEVAKANESTTKKVNKKKAAILDRLLSEPIKVGDSVKLLHSKQPGQVVEIRGDKYVVSFGIMKTSVEREKIILADRKMA